MRFLLKHLTIRQYIKHVRKQSRHVQHVHAFVFAGIITGAIAAVLMYTQYGFWHETYYADDLVTAPTEPFEPESPSESFATFLREAKERFSAIGGAGADMLEGKETYIKEP